MDKDDLEQRFAALAARAHALIEEACELEEQADRFWDVDAYAAFSQLMREAAEKHRDVATAFEAIASECDRESQRPIAINPEGN